MTGLQLRDVSIHLLRSGDVVEVLGGNFRLSCLFVLQKRIFQVSGTPSQGGLRSKGEGGSYYYY